MRKIVLIIFLFLFYGCKFKNHKHVLELEFESKIEGKNVMIFEYGTDGLNEINIDSTKVKNGKAIFNFKFVDYKLCFIRVDGLKEKIPVVIEDDNIKIKVQISNNSLISDVISGYENKILVNYNTKAKDIQNEIRYFQKNNYSILDNAIKSKNRKLSDSLLYKNKIMFLKYDSLMDSQIKNNINSYVSLKLLKEKQLMGKITLVQQDSIVRLIDDKYKNSEIFSDIIFKKNAVR